MFRSSIEMNSKQTDMDKQLEKIFNKAFKIEIFKALFKN